MNGFTTRIKVRLRMDVCFILQGAAGRKGIKGDKGQKVRSEVTSC